MRYFGIKSWYQATIFLCLYVGYMLYIFNRNSFAFMLPSIIARDGVNEKSIGAVLSSIATAYGIGKFISGVLIDKYSPRLMFAAGLFLSGIANLLFSSSSPTYFSLIWFLNGLAQGPGWPACAKVLRRWYSPSRFGTLWSTLSTSMNVPSSLGPMLCSMYIATNDGNWRSVMLLCGTVSCGYSLITLFINKDKPEDVGLTLDVLLQTDNVRKDFKEGINLKKDMQKILPTKHKEATVPDKVSSKSKGNVWQRIFSSFYIYVILLGFFTSLLLKGVVSSWAALYLIQDKGGKQDLADVFLAWFEFGGIFGSIISGYVSDRLLHYKEKKLIGHPRHIMYITWFVIMFLCLLFLQTMVEDLPSQKGLVFSISFVMGFCIYGNISLAGVLVIENSSPEISGTAHAVAALGGNVGLMFSGLPFSMIMRTFGWSGALQFCELLALITAGVFMIAECMPCQIGYKMKSD